MEPGALILSQKLDQHVKDFVIVRSDEDISNQWSFTIMYHFEGRNINELFNFQGFWCFYNPLYEERFLYFGETGNFSTARVPHEIARLADLLQYKLYIAVDLDGMSEMCRIGTVCYMRMYQLPLIDDEDEWVFWR
jgi:hypothetical protein